MGHVLKGSARTTAALRRAIKHSEASIRTLAERYGVNPKTVARRTHAADAPMGPKDPGSTILSKEEEAIIVPSASIRLSVGHNDDCVP
jgi:hypothetical protein